MKKVMIRLFTCVVLVSIYFNIKESKQSYVLNEIETEYKFESGITIADKTYVSTHCISFPEGIRKKGKYEIKNNTGYQVCLATLEEGFLFLEQGKYQITGKPVAFFVIQPDFEKGTYFEGELVISKKNALRKISYIMKGNQTQISEITCRII